MAAWLQKRLKDAEALLEQADRTAQRVVVKDRDKPRNSLSMSNIPAAQPFASAGVSASASVETSLPSAGIGELQGDASRPQHVSAQRQASAAIRSPPQPPPAASAGRPAQIPFSTPTVTPRIPPVSTSRTNRQEKAAAAPSVASAVPQIPFMAPISATATAGRQDIADDELLLASPKQVPSQLLPIEQPTPTAQSTNSSDEDTQQSEAELITASVTEADGTVNNGRSPPRASDQAVMTDIASPQPPDEDTGTQEIGATGESLLQAGDLTAENASVNRTGPEVSDAPATDIALSHNGDSNDVVDQPLVLPQSRYSVEPQEASMQAASSSAKLATTPSSVNDLDAAVTATDDSIEAQAQSLTDQPAPQSSSVLPAMDAAVAAMPSTSDLDLEQAPVPLSALASTLDTEQMHSQASLPGGKSTSETGQMQSQASLPADSSARAAAVADAIKRAAQASGPGQPQSHGTEQGAAGREALLSRLVEQLKGRLQALKEENQQLEDMLHQSDSRASGSVREAERLEDAVSQAEAARISAEAALAHNSAIQEGEVRSAQLALQAATKDLSECQARLADLEATNTLLIQEQQVSEGRIVAALRDEVTAAEMRLEEERAAHTSTQRTAAAREQSLQSSMADGGSALASMQRLVEERTQQASTAQQALMQLQQDHAHLTAHMHSLQHLAPPRPDSASVEAQLELQAEADKWRQESVQTGESLRESQVACDQAQEQVERLQGMLRDLQRHAQDRSSYDELQERFKEVTELLYTKQTQLERMAAEKATQQLAHERQMAHAKDDAERVKRRAKTERASASSGSNLDDVVVPMDSLGEAFDRLANDNRVGSYVKAGAR
ncbi:TPA: hypothetical protein ACH3X1_016587 [Trebouxia sp. C0004]